MPSPSPEAVEAMRKLNEQRPGAAFGIQMAVGMPPNPIQQKVNESHITQALEIAAKSQRNDFCTGLVDRAIQLVIVFCAIGLGIFIIETFKTQPNILIPTLSAFAGFIGGIASGVGLAKSFGRGKGNG